MKVSQRIFALGLVAAFLAGACATVRPTPDWVLQRPAASSDTEFFVVSGFDADGNETRALESASNALIVEINQYLGINVELLAQSEGRGTMDDYEETLRTAVTVSGSGQVAGLRIQDSYTLSNEQGLTVYILAAYDKAALEAERQKREALVAEQEDAVSVPEALGQQAVARGDLVGALQGFSDAAAAALGADIRNAEVKFERNMRALAQTIQSIELRSINVPTELVVNNRPSQAFEVLVLFDGRPTEGVEIRASFSEAQSGGRTRIQSLTVKSGADGIAKIQLPAPTIVGSQNLSLQPDLSGYLRNLEDVPREYRDLSDTLFDNAASKLVRVPYTVISLAREVPLGIFVVETDIAGNPTGQNSTATGISQELTAAGFRITQLNMSEGQLGGGSRANPQTVIQILDQQGTQNVDRIILGSVNLVSVEERDGFLVRVGGSVEVFDRNTGQLLFAHEGIKTSQGASSARAIAAAFTSLGRDFGAAIIRGLP